MLSTFSSPPGRAVIGIAITFAMLAAGCGGAKSRLDSHMQRGETYLAQGDLLKASVEFRNAMQIAPKDDKARLMAGRTAEQLGQIREALGLYQAVADSSPQNAEAAADLARLFVYAKTPEQALKILQPALVLHPDDPVLLTLRGAAQIILNRPTDALADVERALKIAPTDEEAIQVRARLYRKADDLPGAVAFIERAVQQAPHSKILRQVLADLYVDGKQPQQAEQQLRELVRLVPKDVGYRYQVADFLVHDGRLDDAQRVLEEAVHAFPGDVKVKLVLVEFISTRRTRAEGEQVLRGFLAHEPDNHDLRLSLGQLLQRSGATNEAVKVYQEVAQKDERGPAGLIARDRLANIAFSQGRYADARQQLDQVLRKNPRDSDALLLRGQIALSRSDPAAAIVDFRGVLRDQPKSNGVRRLLATAYVANGELALAEESLRAAVELAPADTGLRIELAKLLLRAKRPDQAIALLEDKAHDVTNNAVALDALARAYLDKQDFDNAGGIADRLKTLQPQSAEGFYLAGIAAQGRRNSAEAHQQFEKALALQPQAMDALSALARLELAEGHAARAIALVKGTTEHQAPNAFALNLLGELYLTQNELPAATDTFRRATELEPTWWVPYRSLAAAKYNAHDTAGAIAAYEAGIKAAPKQTQLVSELASLHERAGRVEDAIACYESWYRANPGTQAVANNLAMLLVTYRTDPASLDRARDLTAGFASSSDGNALDTAGWVHFKRAEYAQALAVLERAAQRSPDSREVRYHLGMVELHEGLKERARGDLAAAVAGSASFTGVKEARVALASLTGRAG